MKNFINDDFLLLNEQAQQLYHEYAENMPVIDYHCHLNPAEVAEDKTWENITQIWLYGDHYKWRTMRSNGVDEKFCTGDASDREKFAKFAETMPSLLRNPMYHWSHLELARYFDIYELLSPATADRIWEQSKEKLKNGISARSLMKQSNVKVVCTTDDPVDSLEHHISLKKDSSFDIQMLPAWRPDKAMAVDNPEEYNSYIDRLAAVSGIEISNYSDLIEALRKRHDFFHECGCRMSDHGLETCYAEKFSDTEAVAIFARIRSGDDLGTDERAILKSALMLEFGRMDAEKNWTQQLHIGPMRNNNTLMFKKSGPDIGFDSIGDQCYAEPLSRFLDTLNSEGKLPKTVLYNLNPRDNEMVATMIGNFQDGSVPGKMQFGSGWWFLDQKNGMERQIEALSQLGLLSRFIGMLTDSRSFLSYTRHEYFRRILCNILGNEMKTGLIPDDMKLVGEMVKDISYFNAKRYLGFELEN